VSHPGTVRAVNQDAIRRISERLGPGVIDAIAGLPGADVTTLMIEVARHRADRLDAADVLRRYDTDRFVHPGGIEPNLVRRIEDALFTALPDGFDAVVLSPVAPFGAHRLAGVDQSRVVTTVRSNEVAADPTNGLALEAALRRRALLHRDARSGEVVRLAASQRVLRAQRFEGEGVFSHFQLFGLVSAGRDTGNLGFERDAFIEHVRFATDAIRTLTGSDPLVELTDLTAGRMAEVAELLREALPDVGIEDRPDREGGRVYYDRMCFKAYASSSRDRFEIADGGLVDWTQQLVQSRKERLMISGLGVERLAMVLGNDG
jgi:hypothetical protein